MLHSIPALPRHIALCGHPKSGKSTTQKILQLNFGVYQVDDGLVLREFAVKELGLSWFQVSTQTGKAETVERFGRTWTVRELLGQFGNAIEGVFGKHALPHMAIQKHEKDAGPFSYGSVRRDQGRVYQDAGGIVIEIQNPEALPSPHEFDRFDSSIVDYIIVNDGLARGLDAQAAYRDLEEKVRTVLELHAGIKTLRAAA